MRAFPTRQRVNRANGTRGPPVSSFLADTASVPHPHAVSSRAGGMKDAPPNRVPHLRDGFIVAKVGPTAPQANLPSTPTPTLTKGGWPTHGPHSSQLRRDEWSLSVADNLSSTAPQANLLSCPHPRPSRSREPEGARLQPCHNPPPHIAAFAADVSLGISRNRNKPLDLQRLYQGEQVR